MDKNDIDGDVKNCADLPWKPRPGKEIASAPISPDPQETCSFLTGKKSRGDSPCSFFDVDFIPGHGIVSGTPDYL